MMMRDCLTLQRKIVQRGQTGGQNVPVWQPDDVAADVPCSIQQASASTQLRYMQREMVRVVSIYFIYDYRAKTGDRWVPEDNSVYYNVLAWYKPTLDVWVCDAEEIVL